MPLDRQTKITFLGHATLVIQTPSGKRILVDPWLKGNPACPPALQETANLGSIDVVLLTHIHNDHAGSAAEVAAAFPTAEWVATYEACNFLSRKGATTLHPMNIGGDITVQGIEVAMTFAIHSSTYYEPDGTAVSGGMPAGFVCTMENGFRMYIAGDTALYSDMSLIGGAYQPELAVLPIGDVFTMGPKAAARAAQLLNVRHVLPVHYASFPQLTGRPEALIDELSKIGCEGTTVHAIRPGETLE